MKKVFLLTAIVAALAIVGCSKKDSQIEQNNTTVISDGLEAKQAPYLGYGCLTWYNYNILECNVLRNSDSLCGIYIGCNKDVPVAFEVFFDADNRINMIGIKNYANLPNGASAGLANLISAGWVNILYDAQITDQNLLAISTEDYIPSGTFPIFQSGSDAMIVVSY